MTLRITTAALVLAAAPVLAQTSGVSHPDPTVITSDEMAPAPKPLTPRPSAAVPATAPSSEVYGAYVPYTGPAVPSSHMTSLPATPVEDPRDAMIVVSVPERQGELSEGTLLKTKMLDTLSTNSTMPGSRFTAEVTEPIERNGRVIIPVGSILDGQVTEVHGGKRISGGALLHLETRNVTLPDGTHYIVHAQVIDTGKSEFKVTNEGTLKKKDACEGDAGGDGRGDWSWRCRWSDDRRWRWSCCGRGYWGGSEHGDLAETGPAGDAAEGRYAGVQLDDADGPDSAEWAYS